LQGALRSPTFTITRPFVQYRVGGKGARLRLVIDAFQQIRNPIYGGLEMKVDSAERWQWLVQNVEKWIGHQAYIELLDEGDGFAALSHVAFADQAAIPRLPNAVTALVASRGPKSAQELAVLYKELLLEAARELAAEAGKPRDRADLPRVDAVGAAAPRNDALAAARDWLLTSALPGSLSDGLAALDRAGARLEALARKRAQVEAAISYRRKALVMTDGTGIDDHVQIRGNAHRAGERVPRRFLEALGGAAAPAPQRGSGRMELAQLLVDGQNPLTARVIVNRVWQHHFGEGLVRTPDDFGNMGQPPTHPELLDWLATEFVARGWSLKELHRVLLASSTYQMSSRQAGTLAMRIDPQNLLWHRMNVRRLEAECIRDAVLAVSGSLNNQFYGPGVPPYLTSFMIGRGRPERSGPLDGDGRRSLFINVRRNFLTPMFLAFDYPVPFSTMGKRSVSNVPAQALALMNNPFVLEQSRKFAQRMLDRSGDDTTRVRAMYLATFSREPSENERDAALEYVAAQGTGNDKLAAWADLAHVLLNVKEFVYLP
jgi:hypothetical protein